MYTCIKFLDGLKIDECVLLAKSNNKTVGYLNDIKELKRQEYLDFIKGAPETEENYTEEELREKEGINNALENGMLPYEIEMITGGPDDYTKIFEGIK